MFISNAIVYYKRIPNQAGKETANSLGDFRYAFSHEAG